jgi:hypothetical protein
VFGKFRDQVTDSTAQVKDTADAVSTALLALAIVAILSLVVATAAYARTIPAPCRG